MFAFGGEKVEVDRYNDLLVPAKMAARRKGFYSSISDGITRFLFFVSCALSFWFGVQWVLEDRDKIVKSYTAADLIIVSVAFLVFILRVLHSNSKKIPYFTDIFQFGVCS